LPFDEPATAEHLGGFVIDLRSEPDRLRALTEAKLRVQSEQHRQSAERSGAPAAASVRDDAATPDAPRVRVAGRTLIVAEQRRRADETGATVSDPVDPLVAVAQATAEIARQETPDAMAEQTVRLVVALVPACDEAGIMVTRARGRIDTPAASGELAGACDRLQQELGEGPCFDVLADPNPVTVADLARASRWQRFGPRAADLGAGSVLAVPLQGPRGPIGSLNLYAAATDAFTARDEQIAAAFGWHAGLTLARAELEANLRTGMQTREEIGRAVGILMERHRVTATAAFDMLVVASQHSHRKLRDIAVWMNETGEDPSVLRRPTEPTG
jgi:transcriptional regulator with GAF, ATPase, and Fis domain